MTEAALYHKILSPDYPTWLDEYVGTPAMQRINQISLSCGTDYCGLYNNKWYSNLDHSIGVALIIWHFTNNKAQTLSGLFHDIATPVFKHCIDFMNNDHEKQESTEARTYDIVNDSLELKALLKRDNLTVNEVYNYKKYPIADNASPKLSADRLEYNFSSGLFFKRVWDLASIKDCYDNLIIGKNEAGQPELAFNDLINGEKFITTVSELWPAWIESKDKATMQFLADITRSMIIKKYLSVDDLYKLSERELVDQILNFSDNYLKKSFHDFQSAKTYYESDQIQPNKYCVSINTKKRYIIPLVKTDSGFKRINQISTKSQNEIENFLNTTWSKYCGFNFDFKPY